MKILYVLVVLEPFGFLEDLHGHNYVFVVLSVYIFNVVFYSILFYSILRVRSSIRDFAQIRDGDGLREVCQPQA